MRSRFLALSLLVGMATPTTGLAENLTLSFFPTKPTDAALCNPSATPLLTKQAIIGKTAKTGFRTVGTMYYSNADGGFPELDNFHNAAKLVVLCRGEGTIRLVKDCTTTLATINCDAGTRPWTAASPQFDPGLEGRLEVQVAADAAGEDLEYANPVLQLYAD
jgi:hypothetical protein